MDRQEPATSDDDIRKVRNDIEAMRQVLADPVEAARVTYELLLALRQDGRL